MKMPETARALNKFPALLGKSTLRISYLEGLFEKVLENAEKEFGNRDEHSKRCIQLMLRHLRILFSAQQYDQFLDELIEIMKKREPTANTWRRLIGIISRDGQDHEEQLVGLSLEYASKVEGLYKIDVRICYLLSRFAIGEHVSWLKVLHTRTNELRDYFETSFDDTGLFEGCNNHVRNAIAHSSYYYDKRKRVMKYQDNQWVSELSYDKLMEMSQKLMNVCELVDVLVRLIPVRKFSMIKDLEHFKSLGIDVVCL